MARIYLTSVFSLQMLEDFTSSIETCEVKPEDVPSGFISGIGNPDIAHVIAGALGTKVQVNRINVKLAHGDVVYVAQLVSKRLSERGNTSQKNFPLTLKFIRVAVKYPLLEQCNCRRR